MFYHFEEGTTITHFQIKITKKIIISSSSTDVIDDDFIYNEGCYNIGVLTDDSTDDTCLDIGVCQDVNESFILECIQYNFGF